MFRNGTRHTFVSAAVTTALATASALAYSGPVLASSSSGKAHSQAIIGTGADAIIGTGADAIIGTGADAIIGTGADSVAHRGKVSSASSKRYLIASGPAEVLDAARGVIRVMGRTVSAPIDSNLFATVANAAGSGSAATVTIYGQVDSRGALSNAIAQPGSATYVPGASAIVVTDIVRSIDARTGTVLIGNLKVDYTAMLAVSAVPLKAGKVATVVGTQPQAGQAIIAQRIIAR